MLIYILIGIIILLTGVVAGFVASRREQGNQLKGHQGEAREALERRTEERKKKILEFMKKEAEHMGELKLCGIDTARKEFDRQDVEKLLDVSDNTALKYLNELEAEGKVQQVGKGGPGVYYQLKGV